MGLLLSAFIATLWLVSFFWSLQIEIEEFPLIVVLLIILCRAFLQTGIFIVAHDAIHGNVIPGKPAWNSAIVRIALFCCGGMPYEVWKKNHERHHERPSHPDDPDFHNGTTSNFILWYLQFSKAYFPRFEFFIYISRLSFLCLSILFLSNASLRAILFFAVLPIILSSLQLFLFGTYLPHKEKGCIKSYYFPPVLSLIACYNFSYHLEHHQYPNTPWYLLPKKSQLVSQKRKQLIPVLISRSLHNYRE